MDESHIHQGVVQGRNIEVVACDLSYVHGDVILLWKTTALNGGSLQWPTALARLCTSSAASSFFFCRSAMAYDVESQCRGCLSKQCLHFDLDKSSGLKLAKGQQVCLYYRSLSKPKNCIIYWGEPTLLLNGTKAKKGEDPVYLRISALLHPQVLVRIDGLTYERGGVLRWNPKRSLICLYFLDPTGIPWCCRGASLKLLRLQL